MEAAKRITDATTYPESDDMGEHETHFQIAVLLVPLLTALMALRRRVARVGGNQFWYFVAKDPKQVRAPDVYVVDGVSPDAPDRGVWRTWDGHRPAFALEIVSAKWQKDYLEAPEAYAAMRAKEVVVFDPWATARSRRRVRWQVFRRVRGRGFVKVFAGGGDRVEARELGCWIRVVEDSRGPRLRLATGAHGDDLLPTEAEAAAAERLVRQIAEAQAEAERIARVEAEAEAREANARTDAERAAKEAERAARETAEAEVVRLRAELARRGPAS